MSGDPDSGSEVWKAPDREIGKPGENRGQVIAHRDSQQTAAFHDRVGRLPNSEPGIANLRLADYSRTNLVLDFPQARLNEALAADAFACSGVSGCV